MKRMEWVLEREERERRKRNLVFKGVKVRNGKIEEELLKLCREMGTGEGIEIEELKRVKTGGRW